MLNGLRKSVIAVAMWMMPKLSRNTVFHVRGVNIGYKMCVYMAF